MPRVKRGKLHTKKRRRILSQTKGYKGSQRNKIKHARQSLLKAYTYQFRDRKAKKRTMRQLWNIRINAGARSNNTTYSKLIHGLKAANIEIDRKILADLAANNPEVFTKVVEAAKK